MTKKFDIYFTSDCHGKIMPVDYASGERKACGLLNLSEQIEKSGNTLVLDGGDNLQGTPLMTYYLEHASSFSFHPCAEGFNACGLDAYTLGNHDFNFDYDAISAFAGAMKADLICANVEDLGGKLSIKKWEIRTLENGLRIGLTGAVTGHVNVWEKKEHLKKLRVTDPVSALKEALDEMKDLCDVTVCIYHGGYEEAMDGSHKLLSDSTENQACRIARETSFDILLTGHQHMAVEGLDLYGTWTVQPPANAEKFIHLCGEVDGKGTVSVTSKLLPVGDQTRRDIYEKLLPLEDPTEEWLDQPIGSFEEELTPESKLDCALYGSRVARFFNAVQLFSINGRGDLMDDGQSHGDRGKGEDPSRIYADISAVSLGNQPIGFPKEVSIRDVYTAYPFANNTVVKRISGADLREALERCATYLDLDSEGRPYISDVFMKPKVEHYNYDFYAGIDYAFDLRKPRGERVVRLCRLDGSPIAKEDQLNLVTSDYRATGTGGYEMIGRCPTVYTGADNVQDLIIDYIRNHKPVQIMDNVRFQVIYK